MKSLKYSWYRFLWDYAERLPLRQMPVHLDLELTSRCNLACVMCPHGENEKKFKTGDMPLDMAKALIKQGAGRIQSIKLNWRGEPTLYKDLPEVIAFAKQHKYVDVMINTNLNCGPERLQEIVDAGIDKIIVSIDSFDQNTYSQIRKGGRLNLVLKNLEFLRNLRQTRKNPFVLVVQARRQKLNESEVFPKHVLVKPATQRTDQGDYLCGGHKAAGRTDCLMPMRRLLVSWDGNVFGCCADWFEKRCVGQIKPGLSMDLSAIWKGDAMNRLRQDLKSGRAFEYEPCKTCVSRESYLWKK